MGRFVTLVLFLALIGAGGYVWYSSELKAVDVAVDSREIVRIAKGASTQEIAETLKEKGLIRSSLAFRVFTYFQGADRLLQAGSFSLSPAMNAKDILSSLMRGYADEAVITIPEGFTVQDIDTLLAEKGLIEEGDLIECANSCDFSEFDFLPSVSGLARRGGKIEGYLFPDTYFVLVEDFSAEEFLKRLLHTFEDRVLDDLGSDFEASSRSVHAIITMASLIEEETVTDDERAIVSGILWKREDEGMGLGVDAAVRYILNKPTAAITVADLNVNSPYNLRKFRGLSPGPIANPGKDSVIAALNPEESSYWYYLHDPQGNIHYAETNTEHNINRQIYLQ